ncbi:hypothetical protein Fcan01_07216 [Folsomia candida]|uniref:Uncharacterized protein n=1 Tax=Folsomia candida TaxID=158441 RepID=A0A226EIA4_FOLCA|nr:hypothetical protein Fcan01_07216 [Folsomia candida]
MPITRERRMALAGNIGAKVKNRWRFQEGGSSTSRLMGQSGSLLLLYLLLIAPDIGGGEEWSGGRECNAALGMESFTIPPHQISASSSYNEENTGPQFSRQTNAKEKEKANENATSNKTSNSITPPAAEETPESQKASQRKCRLQKECI